MSPMVRNVLGWTVCLVLVTVALFGFTFAMIFSPEELSAPVFKGGVIAISFTSAVVGLKLKDVIAGTKTSRRAA